MFNLLFTINGSENLFLFFQNNLFKLLGISLALVGAVLLSLGAQYQSRGLNKVEVITGESAASKLSFNHIKKLLSRPSWVVGTSFLVLATVFQLGSLSVSPITLVQPIGVTALIITAIMNSRIFGISLGARGYLAVFLSVTGITGFVMLASLTVEDRTVTDRKLATILILYAVVILLTVIFYIIFRYRSSALSHILGAGILYGFVATLAKTIISRFQQQQYDFLLVLSLIALISGVLFGMVLVQNAYSTGSTDLVIAGLTVIDPLVAVLIGLTVLGEASNPNPLAFLGFSATGALAIFGVFLLSKHHQSLKVKPQQRNNLLPVEQGPSGEVDANA